MTASPASLGAVPDPTADRVDPARASARRYCAALLLTMASGAAGLGYQIVWTQQCAAWLGHESAAVLAVVAALFGGVALGATATGRSIERSARPLRWYAACEATIATWGLVLHFAMPAFGRSVQAMIGVQPAPAWQWTVAFAATFVLLLPATAAMGATIPAIERVASSVHGRGRSIAAWYAANTAGAVIGVLVAAFWLVPTVGLSNTALFCITSNLLCAATSLAMFPQRTTAVDRPRRSIEPAGRDALLRLAATGFLGIGYEVLLVRVLSQVAEDTVYTFALLLAVYLAGTATGAALYRRRADGADDRARGDRLMSAVALACLFGTATLWGDERVRSVWFGVVGDGLVQSIGVEAALAVLAFGLPTVAMGALFSHLCATASDAGVAFGTSLGVNALAAAAAPLAFGVLLTPWLGPQVVLLSIAAAYAVLVSRQAWRTPLPWVAVVVAAIAAGAPPLAFVDVPDGGRVVSYSDGVMAAVSVTEDADGVARLRIDNRQQEGSSATLLVDARQALLPVLLHAAPRHALFLGLGTGVTAASAAEDPRLEVDAVELLPEVIDVSHRFTEPFDAGRPSRLHLMAADARRYVSAASRRYDVIVADNYHPARSGSGALYTVEHFEAIRERLAADGLFCQWLPLHQLDLDTLRSIVRSFVTVYPGGWALLASNSLGTPVVGLVARRDGTRFDPAAIRARLAASELPRKPAAFGLDDEFALLGSFVAGPAALARFAGDAAVNTDDRPVVTYRAPRITYAPTSTPQDRLMALLAAWSIAPAELIVDAPDASESDRLARYWSARDRYLDAGRDVRVSSDVRVMLAQVRQPLLALLRTSPDFRPAYDPLLRMAVALARSDAAAGRTLLAELVRLQPARPEAAEALRALDARRPAP